MNIKLKKLATAFAGITFAFGCAWGADSVTIQDAGGADISVYEVSSGFYQSGTTYNNSTDFYITSKEGLEYFRDLVNQVGTVADTYVSTFASGTAADWYTTGIFGGKTVHLMTDVDLNNEEWSPIGQPTNTAGDKRYFYGNFNGENHTIRNLKATQYTEATKTWNPGLFGFIGSQAGQTFSNLTIENVTLVGYDYAGAVVGNAGSNATAFNNCHVTGAIDIKCMMTGAFVGGIVGIGTSAIDDCSVEGTAGSTIQGSTVGGLAGTSTRTAKENANTVTDSTVTGVTVKSDDNGGQAGGLVGKATNPVSVTGNTVHDVMVSAEAGKADVLVGGVGGDVTASSNTTDTNVTVISDPITGSGTAEDPYIIANIDALKAFRDRVNAGNTYAGKFFKLTTDVDLNNEEWDPIGSNGREFKGTFDGDNHTVSNLKVTGTTDNESANNRRGFFGSVRDGKVLNLTIANADVSGSLYIGGIAGQAYTSVISNCNVTGSIDIRGWWYIGGITGGQYVNIYDSSVIGTSGSAVYSVNDTGSYVGGIYGFHGEDYYLTTNCVVKNLAIHANDRVGGIGGIAHYGNAVVDCTVENVTISSATDNNNCGLIVGADQSSSSSTATVIDCTVGAGATATAGTGEGERPVTTQVGAANNGGTLKTAEDSALVGSDVVYDASGKVVGGTFEKIPDSALAEGFGPVANEQGLYTVEALQLIATVTTGGTTKNYYDLHKALEAGKAAGSVVTLLVDVDLAGVAWEPVGTSADPFCGSIDGNGKTISNLSVSKGGSNYAGLIGYAKIDNLGNSSFANMTLSNVTVVADKYVGALLGNGHQYPTIDNVTVTGTIEIRGHKNVGGIAGGSEYGRVVNSSVIGDGNGIVEATYTASNGDGENVGGISGHISESNSLRFQNSSVSGITVLGAAKVGGIAGVAFLDNIIENVSAKDIKVGLNTTTDYTGVEGNGKLGVGGLVGVYYTNGSNNGKISGTVEDVTIIANANGIDQSHGLVTGGLNASKNTPVTLPTDPVLTATGYDYAGLIAKGYDAAKYSNDYLINNYKVVVTDAEGAFVGGFATLAAAVAEATEGQTITLLADATDSLVTIPSTVTLNAGGFDYTAYIGAGTSADPYQIGNLSTLKAFRDAVNGGNTYSGKSIKLTSDIDLNNEEWEPIGIYSYRTKADGSGQTVYPQKPFCGTFDGDGHTISNLKMTVADGSSKAYQGAGLFGYTTAPAAIKNLNIRNAEVQGRLYVGALVGNAYTGQLIDNCHVSGVIKIEGSWYVGGLCGQGYMNKVTNCSVVGDVGSGSYVRGRSVVDDMYADDSSGYIGGLWGFRGEGGNVIADCTVKNISVQGEWNGTGGICGIAHYGNIISNCTVEAMSVTALEDENNCGLIAGSDLSSAASSAKVLDCTVAEGATASAGTGANQREVTTWVGAANNNGVLTTPANSALVGFDVIYDESGKVTGGTFEKIPDAIIAEGFEAVADSETGLYTLKHYVAQVGDQKFETLAEAIAAANDDVTVKMLADVSLDVYVRAQNKKITLDLNGKTVSCGAVTTLLVDGAQLTIDDTSESGEGKVVSTSDNTSYGVVFVQNAGAIIVNAGMIVSDCAARPAIRNANAAGCSIAVAGGAVKNTAGKFAICAQGDADVTITDGAVSAPSWTIINYGTGDIAVGGGSVSATSGNGAIENISTGNVIISGEALISASANQAIRNDAAGKVTVMEGTVSALYYAVNNRSTGPITISGGDINAVGFAILNYSDGEVTISDGNIESVAHAVLNAANGTVTITGGSMLCKPRTGYEGLGEAAIYNGNYWGQTSDPPTTGVINISGGTIRADYRGAIENHTGTLNISGGDISSLNSAIMNFNPGGAVTVSGNAAITADVDPNGNGCAIQSNSSDTDRFEIAGGKILGTIYFDKGTYSITGGIFSVEPTKGVAEGYSVVDNPDTATKEAYPYTVVSDYEAQIVRNGVVITPKGTLAEMVAAAQDGDTIQLLKDIELSGTDAVEINKVGTYTIDGNGYSITPANDCVYTHTRFRFGMDGTSYTDTKNYIVTNLTISGFTDAATYFIRAEGCSLMLADCTITNNNLASTAGSRLIVIDDADLTLDGCDIVDNTSASYLVDFNTNGRTNGTGGTLDIDNCLFDGNTAGETGLVYSYGSSSGGDAIKNTTFTGNTVSGGAAAVIYFSGATDVTGCLFTNNTVTATDASQKCGVLALGSGAAGSSYTNNAFVGNTLTSGGNAATIYVGAENVTLTNNYWGDGAAPDAGNGADLYLAKTGGVVYNTYASSYAVNENGVSVFIPDYVAQIVRNNAVVCKYETLAATIAAAQTGDTIELLDDYTMTDAMNFIGKSVTLDLGGNTLKVAANVNRLASGGVTTTITNGVIDISGTGNTSGTAGIFSAGHPLTGAANGGNTINIMDVTLTGAGYNGHSVFQLYDGCALNIENSTVGLTNCLYSSGGFVKSDGSSYVVPVTIKNSTVDLVNTVRGFLDGQTAFINSTVNIIGDATIAGDTGAKLDNGFNYNATTGAGTCIALTNSTVTVRGGTGRGITLNGKDVIVADGSTLAISDMTEGDFMFKKAESDNKVVATGASTVTAGSVVLKVDANAGELFVAQDTSTVPTFVAQIGRVPYSTLAAAIEGAQTGDTIELLGDYTMTDAMNFIGKSVTLDLGGNTLKVAANVNRLASGGVTTTITNGVIDISGTGNTSGTAGIFSAGHPLTGAANGGNTINIMDVTLTGAGYNGHSVFQLYAGCALNIENSTVGLTNCLYSSGGFVKSDGSSYVVPITIKDSTIDLVNTQRGFIDGQTAFINSTVNIIGDATIAGDTGAKLDNGFNYNATTGDGTCIALTNSTVTVSGGTGRGITLNGKDVIVADGSTLAISDMAEGDFMFKKAESDNKVVATGASTVTAGTVVLNVDANAGELFVAQDTSTVPTFVAQIGRVPYRTFAEAIAAADATLAETGVDPVITVIDSTAEQSNLNWKFVTDSGTGVTTLVRKVYVAQIVTNNGATTNKYETLETAYSAATSGDTIEMLADYRLSVALTFNKSVTLTGAVDEDGKPKYTIYGNPTTHLPGGMPQLFINSPSSPVDLAFQNLNFSEFGNERSAAAGYGFIYISKNSNADTHLLISNVTMTAFNCDAITAIRGNVEVIDSVIDGADAPGELSYGIRVGNHDVALNPTLNVVRTVIRNIANDETWAGQAIVAGASSSVTVTDCTITNVANGVTAIGNNANASANAASVTIENTLIDASSRPFDIGRSGYDGEPVTPTQINVTSGTFYGIVDIASQVAEKAVIAISGGYFDREVPKLFCADGYIPTPQDPVTGLYTVRIGYAKDDEVVVVGDNDYPITQTEADFLNDLLDKGGENYSRDAITNALAGMSVEDFQEAALLNIDITKTYAKPVFSITAIKRNRTAGTVSVTVTLDRKGKEVSNRIYGILVLKTSSDGKTWGDGIEITLNADDFGAEGHGTTAIFTMPAAPNAKLYKAMIVDPAEITSGTGE